MTVEVEARRARSGPYVIGVGAAPWKNRVKAGARVSLFLWFWCVTWHVEWAHGD